MAETGSDIEIRPPTPADLPAIGELYRAVKGRPRPPSVDRQRLFDTPWGDSPALIALDGERCVSLAVMWPAALSVGGEVVLGAQGTDAATHPDYRRRLRLFIGIARGSVNLASEMGYEALYTFPNPRSIKLTKHVGATYLGEVPSWGVSLEGRRLPFQLALPRRKDAVVGDPGESELAALVAAAHADATVIRVDKSPAWFSWRYSPDSAEHYTWLTARDGRGALTAAGLIGERDAESWGADFAGIFRVHELVALGDDAAASVLRGAVAHVRGRGGRKLDVLVKDPALERAVERAGFTRETDRPITTVKLTPRALPADLFDFDAWRLISGDMDFF